MSTVRARELRKRMSPPEAKLWNLLRGELFATYHFRRQVPIGRYFADFASHSAKLVIEVDGSQHFEDSAQRYDRERTAFIAGEGYSVLRFDTVEVLGNLESVAAAVIAALPPPTALRAVPPPHKGEGVPTASVRGGGNG